MAPLALMMTSREENEMSNREKKLPEDEDWYDAMAIVEEQATDGECPEGGDHDFEYHRGFAQTLETPAELAGWACNRCGVWKQE